MSASLLRSLLRRVPLPVLLVGALLASASIASIARADTGIRVGPHAGVALGDEAAPYVGLGLRLTAPTSPVTFQPSFSYVFDDRRTLYHVAGNVLYELPLELRLRPYLGVGANFTGFRLKVQSTTEDGEGFRLGMNLVAGARLELPYVTPFIQVTKGIGELDAVALGGGVELSLREKRGTPEAPSPHRFAVTPYLANNAVGDVQSGRLGLGMSIALAPWQHFGFELDGELHGHFFRDEDVAHLAGEGVDLNTFAAMLSASGIFQYCASGPAYGTWCPYATAGAGVVRAWFDGTAHEPGAAAVARAQTDPALTAGLGLTHLLTPLVGLRVDARYFRVLVAENAPQGGYFEDYGFLRLAVGVSLGF